MTDVCLLVEGAYPYVTGGVSSWLHALVSNLPNLTFAIVHIGARPDPGRKALYRLPENVVEFREIFINDPGQLKRRKPGRHRPSVWHDFHALHEAVAMGNPYDINLFMPMILEPGFAGLTASDLFHAPESWAWLVKLYQLYASEESFVDFFWTFRFTYLPIFTILEASLPQARVYHSVSTGFCGLLGALAKIRSDRPFMVTEHGLYTREREIEISQSAWLSQLSPTHRIHEKRMGFFQQWWFNIYRFMEKLTYDTADSIISITAVNQKYQLKGGADPKKLKIIPNGIDIQRLAQLRQPKEQEAGYQIGCAKKQHNAYGRADILHLEHMHQQKRHEMERFLVGFIGRIVPIKDVKTFIRALKIAHQTIPNLEAYLVGPCAEDPEYFRECCRLVELLKLDAVAHFTGPADVRPYYSEIEVVVLTSLSEGQPLVVLEGNCAGLPVIATDVGACRELLIGVSPEDQALGASGIITPVASPHETALAIIQLWRDNDLRLRMGRVGQERTRRFYHQEQLYNSYDELYRSYILQKEK